jgi:DNA polymerase-3 subunit gamma/tau
VLARLDRLEKRLTITGTPSAPVAAPTPPPAQDRPVPPRTRPAPPEPEPAAAPVVAAPPEPTPAPEPEPEPEPAQEAAPEPAPEPAPASEQVPSGRLTLVDVRRLWPDIVDATKMRRRLAWMHLTQNCQVVAVDATTLTLGFANAGARDSFVAGGCDEVLRQAAIDVVGASWKIETIVDPGAQAEGTPTVTRAAVPEPEPAPEPAPEPPKPGPDASAAAREAIQQTRTADAPRAEAGPDWASADAEAHPDDLDAEHQGMSTQELLQRELGAQVVEEIRHQ